MYLFFKLQYNTFIYWDVFICVTEYDIETKIDIVMCAWRCKCERNRIKFNWEGSRPLDLSILNVIHIAVVFNL